MLIPLTGSLPHGMRAFGGMRTKIDILETVAAHLIAQGVRSVDADGGCTYRNPDNNTACAVGCLIRPEAYTDDIEGLAVCGLRHTDQRTAHPLRKALNDSDIPTDIGTIELLEALQAIHDKRSVDAWGHELAEIRHRIQTGWYQ